MNENKKKKTASSVWLSVVIAVVIVVLLNVFVTLLGEKVSLKADMTTNKMFELSDKTYEYLKDYSTPTEIYMLAGESEQDDRIKSVIEKYSAANSNIKVTNINMSENPTFGKKYVEDGNTLSANSVIVDSGDRFKLFTMTELYGVNAQTGQYTSLNVENKITSALKYVSSDKQLKACFTVGHNELAVEGAQAKLEDENYTVEETDTIKNDIPEDTDLLMIVRPTADFSQEEISKLDAYLLSGGSIQCYFDVDSKNLTNLYNYLKSWGIGVKDEVVVETDMSNSIALGESGVALVVPEVNTYEFTESIVENKRTLAYFPYSKSLTQEFEENGDITVMSILTSSDEAYTTANEIVAKTGGEQDGTYNVGMLSVDKKHGSSVYVSGNTMLLTVDESTLANNYGLANYDYFMNLINYTTGSDDSFTVNEKALVSNVISVSQLGAVIIFIFVVIIVPIAVFVCGLVIWIRRRNL